MDGKESLPEIDDQENEKVISFELDQLGNNQDYGEYQETLSKYVVWNSLAQIGNGLRM